MGSAQGRALPKGVAGTARLAKSKSGIPAVHRVSRPIRSRGRRARRLSSARVLSASSESSSETPTQTLECRLPSVCSTANSSPPNRATRSVPRMQLVSRLATSRRSSSPAAWPSVSFTGLNRSRSRYMIANGLLPRVAPANSRRRRSRKVARLASPVSESVRASSAISCSAIFSLVRCR
jgi:hypothetical protein